MAHFAQINDSNIVINVTVVANDDAPNEAAGIAFCKALLGNDTNWVQSSYNNNIRHRHASVGMVYDSTNNVFREQQPYPSWILNTSTWEWDAPVALPDDEGFNAETGRTIIYAWVEDSTSWARTVQEGRTEKPYPSWTLNNSTWEWEAPVALPSDQGYDDEDDPTEFVGYDWDEDSTSWTNRTVYTA